MSTIRSAPARSIDVLIVDDSAVVRQRLKEIIEAEPAFRTLSSADPYEAVEVMKRTAPRVILLDLHMPRMDGLTFLKKLMRQHPMPVFLVTDHPARGIEALEHGALGVIAKPDWSDPKRLDEWGVTLLDNMRIALARGDGRHGEEGLRILSEPRHAADTVIARRPYQPAGALEEPIIAVGASTGGVSAVSHLLSGLPRDVPGVVIVQHMPAGFTAAFAERLDRNPKVSIQVREARHGEQVKPGTALVIPGHKHGLIRRASGHYWVELADGPPVCRHRPSVEVLFRSAGQAAGPKAAGVILTGMGDDGAGGLREMRDDGAHTIAQDQATSTVFGMPKSAIDRGGARRVLPLDRIPDALVAWAGQFR